MTLTPSTDSSGRTEPARTRAADNKPSAGEFYIPSLDGLRTVSFLLVFLAHVGLGDVIPGGFGVTVFFFLSGYLITTLLRIEHERTGRNSLRDFYLRRAFRILPPFYAVLMLAYLSNLLGLVTGPLEFSAAISLLCHFSNYRFIHNGEGFPAGTVVYWSLAVEEHFYLAFPLLFVLLNRWFPKRQGLHAAVLVGLCGLVLCWRFALTMVWHVPFARLFMSTDTRVDSILFGCILALVGNPMLDAWRGSRALWCYVLFPLGLAGLGVSFALRADWFRDSLRYSVQGVALIPLFVTAIRYPEWAPMQVLNWPVMRRLGLLSYSLYLCHQVVLFPIAEAFPHASQVLLACAALALSLVVAALIRQFIERPSARARKRWVSTAWLKPRAVDADVATPVADAANVAV
jgi:peptidoglycan/LPS O-acetylase OafA/YrhL